MSQELVLPTELDDTRGVVICQVNQQYCSFDVWLNDDQVNEYYRGKLERSIIYRSVDEGRNK